MKTGCFGCDVVLEADDAEGIADAFVAHTRDAHEWDYPEDALRNFARNFAEAGERLSGDTERLDEIGDVEIHPVTVDRIDDWLQLFDHDGFAGNPDWASCYCLFPHEPPSPDMPERLWTDSRSRMVERLSGGTTFGYLAYVDGRVAGWVNASSRADYADFLRILEPGAPEPESAIGVSCFVIAPPYRRHGAAAALRDRVVSAASARGASWVEGYPRNDPEDSDAGHFTGPRSLYDARGFEQVSVREKDTVVRRAAP